MNLTPKSSYCRTTQTAVYVPYRTLSHGSFARFGSRLLSSCPLIAATAQPNSIPLVLFIRLTMGSCTECRAAKVKCDQVFPCGRCRRLDRACIPHVSRQGQKRPAAAASRDNKSNIDRQQQQQHTLYDNGDENEAKVPVAKKTREDAAITEGMLEQLGMTHTTPNNEKTLPNDNTTTTTSSSNSSGIRHHYGLSYLVRQWMALSIKRRSWKLWAQAANLARVCGMSMDDVLCDDDDNTTASSRRRGMDCLYPFLLTPGAQQQVVGTTPLQPIDVPAHLWRAIGIALETTTTTTSNDLQKQAKWLDQALEHRWIFVRETNRGVSRFYVSPAFARHVVSRQLIEETCRTNKYDIADLYMTEPECGNTHDFVRGFTSQVALHKRPGMHTPPTRLRKVKIKTKRQNNDDNDGTTTATVIQEVDQLWCLAIANLDQSFGLTEFLPKQPNNSKNTRDSLKRRESQDGTDEKQQLTTTQRQQQGNTLPSSDESQQQYQQEDSFSIQDSATTMDKQDDDDDNLGKAFLDILANDVVFDWDMIGDSINGNDESGYPAAASNVQSELQRIHDLFLQATTSDEDAKG